MSATYCNISEAEFDNVLKAEKGWVKTYQQGTEEIVYCFTMKSRPDVDIKVYSSIKKSTANARGCGQDAIRICAIRRLFNGRTCGIRKNGRINRVPNWETRLQDKIVATITDIKENG